MLNPFPIQFLALVAYLILRVFLGAILMYLGIQHLKYKASLVEGVRAPFAKFYRPFASLSGIIEIVLGLMFIAGFFTQIAALATILMSGKMIVLHRFVVTPLVPNRMFYALLLGCALSLFITGAGAFAFDLPI